MTAEQFKYIANLDMDADGTGSGGRDLQLADMWLKDEVLNQPIRMNSDNLTCELGQDRFSAAASVWRRISAAEPVTVAANAEGEELATT